MLKKRAKRDSAPSIEKFIILLLAQHEPLTKRATSKAIHKHYKSTWDAFERLIAKRLVQPITTVTYNSNEYSRYWLTDEGMLRAAIEGARLQKLLERAKILYPNAKAIQILLEITQFVRPEVLKLAFSTVRGKGKIGIGEVIALYIVHKEAGMDTETARKFTATLRKYPEEYSKLRTSISKMIDDLNQLIAE